MRHATLRQLRIFEALARLGNYSRAAEEIHVTQPAVSVQMRQLEALVGLPLMEQVGKNLTLTAAGREVLAYSRRILEEQNQAEKAIAAMRGLEAGELSIAVVSTAKYFAPRLLMEFWHAYPGLQLKLNIQNRDLTLRSMSNNEVDLAIMGRPPEKMAVVAEKFAPHPHVIIAPAGHHLAARKRIQLEEIVNEPFLVRERGSGTRLLTDKLFAGHGLKLEPRMEIASNETIKQAVIAGMGLSLLSAHTLGLEGRVGRLIALHVEGLPLVRSWHVIHRKGKHLTPAANALREMLLKRGAKLIETALADSGSHD
ncbi:MAG: LysR substrate-binding domain-containing protein [Gammaproteobacteria bacterium]